MYQADKTRYDSMKYFRCGASGLKLPAVSLGFWHNFGDTGVFENMRNMCFTAFDRGITHFLTWPITTARSLAAPRKTLARSLPRTSSPIGTK